MYKQTETDYVMEGITVHQAEARLQEFKAKWINQLISFPNWRRNLAWDLDWLVVHPR